MAKADVLQSLDHNDNQTAHVGHSLRIFWISGEFGRLF